ncbi:MAG: S-layer homology domain-containing protein [Oscillospiraceae bacterium]
MKKRAMTLLLALTVAVSCLMPLHTLAAPQKIQTVGFSDVRDSDTAAAVEVLRMLGAVGGYGDGTFHPDTKLTRAQFCKMAALVMGSEEKAAQYKNYTIFPDVKASYWAAGYINYAVRGEQVAGGGAGGATGGTGGGTPAPVRRGIISGFADGSFGPEKTLTYGQAVTILMRMLKYEDTDVGAVWPQGYLSTADSIHLTAGLNLSANDPVTRGQAARLFANLLATPQKGGTAAYVSTLGTVVANEVLLSSAAVGTDGNATALLLSDGKKYPAAKTPGTGILNGRKGTLLLDSAGRARTFVPDQNSGCKTFVVSAAKADSLSPATGNRYDVSADTVAYYQGKKSTYGEVYTYLPGNSVTVTLNAAGRVEYVFAGTESSTNAVVVSDRGSVAGFDRLTGGASYAIYKNGMPASSGDLRQYDVATYSNMQGAIVVTDSKLTGILEDAYPNLSTPSKMTLMGHSFEVLPSAIPDFAKLHAGDSVTLLLTDDNKVAGILPATAQNRGNAIGIASAVSASSVKVRLLNGLELSGNPGLGDDASSYEGQLVRVASDRKGMLYLSRLTGGNSYPNLDVTTRQMGSSRLADNVLIYEKSGDGKLSTIALSQLPQSVIGGGRIVYAGYDWANRVNLLILGDVAGNGYLYGRLGVTPGETHIKTTVDADGVTHTQTITDPSTVTLSYGEGKMKTFTTNSVYTSGDYVGIAVAADGSIAGVTPLMAARDVPNSAWNGAGLVNVNGMTYTVSEDVVCYNKATGKFLTLGAARAWANTANLYYDKTPGTGGQIRVVEVG